MQPQTLEPLPGRSVGPTLGAMRGGRTAAVAVVALLAVVGAGWTFGRPAISRRQDIAARRSAYRSFPLFPGATKVDERSYEIKGDGVGTGEYGLAVTYRLPVTATSSDVIRFFRENMPPGWHEATDETCAGVAARMPPPPRATAPPNSMVSPPTSAFSGRLVLLRTEGELAVFDPGLDRPGEGRFSGVTFKVSAGGEGRLLTLEEVTFACQPA